VLLLVGGVSGGLTDPLAMPEVAGPLEASHFEEIQQQQP